MLVFFAKGVLLPVLSSSMSFLMRHAFEKMGDVDLHVAEMRLVNGWFISQADVPCAINGRKPLMSGRVAGVYRGAEQLTKHTAPAGGVEPAVVPESICRPSQSTLARLPAAVSRAMGSGDLAAVVRLGRHSCSVTRIDELGPGDSQTLR
ncbi:hypothetical protein ACWCOV_19530 [Kribbella sp. NPDC002412]